MKIDEALQHADQWTEGHTFYEGMQGWRIVCAVLAAEVRRLRNALEQAEMDVGVLRLALNSKDAALAQTTIERIRAAIGEGSGK